MHKRSERGYTLIELMITIGILCIVLSVALPLTLAGANFWCTERGVEKQLKAEYPEVNEIVTINRSVIASTKVLAKTKDGKTLAFCLDTNVMFNYDIEPCSK